jgi:hypothetical protein
MSRMVIPASRLLDRRAHYLMDQQVGLHGTIVSIALGVAGLAAASLIEVPRPDRPFHALLWLFWTVSLVVVGAVYSGMTVAVYVTPSTVPSAPDMFLPFGVGLMEFLLFAVLTSPLTSELSARSVIAAWFGALSLLCVFASLAISRARWLFQHTVYEPRLLQEAADKLIRLMRWDVVAATSVAVLSAAAAVRLQEIRATPMGLAYAAAAVFGLGTLAGIVNQRFQAKSLESALRTLESESSSPQDEPVQAGPNS